MLGTELVAGDTAMNTMGTLPALREFIVYGEGQSQNYIQVLLTCLPLL